MRFTKIVCTLGPSSRTRDAIRSLAANGMDVARINFSHGTLEEHHRTIAILKEWNAEQISAGRPTVAILLDTRGAEIRTGDTESPFVIAKGEEIIFSPSTDLEDSRKIIQVNYSGFGNDVRETDRILIDNGEMVFDIVKVQTDGNVVARAREAGKIGSRRHINLPGADVDLPSITNRDWRDIGFGAAEQMDFVALSFIRNRDDIESVRLFLAKRDSSMEIIAKIETKQAVENIAEIVTASDGIMVARGDLGAELPFETIPAIQDEIVMRCSQAGKPVIIATHMLESMVVQASPTRAEVTDIAHAATTSTDATMLSGETASGRHPLLALDAMDRVLRATEEHLSRLNRPSQGVRSEREARAEAAFTLAESTNTKALLAFTKSGQTARDLAKFRPRIPIITFTDRLDVQRKLRLSYGVLPYWMQLSDDPEETVLQAIGQAKASGLLVSGDHIVIVSDTKAHEQLINTVQLRIIP